MSGFTPGLVAAKHKKDIQTLRGSAQRISLRLSLIFLLCLLLAVGNILLKGDGQDSLRRFQNLREGLLNKPTGDRYLQYLDEHLSYDQWLSRYGLGFERSAFNILSEEYYDYFVLSTPWQEQQSGAASFFSLALLGLQRSTFLILASWHILLLVVVLALGLSRRAWRPSQGEGFLHKTGNGRLFFSGIRVALENLNAKGLPELQLPGLCCPAAISLDKAKASNLAAVLGKYAADNETNLRLAAIILAHADWPAPLLQELEALNKDSNNVSLLNKSCLVLEGVLALHCRMQTRVTNNGQIPGPGKLEINCQDYHADLLSGLDAILTPALKREICSISPATLATALLSLEASTVMSISKQGGNWVPVSNFPNLNARAVLHSLPAFAADYDSDERTLIRRALVYASRQSIFASVNFPNDMSDKEFALRQWVELLLTPATAVESRALELQILSLVREINAAWSDKLFTKIGSADCHWLADIYATHSSVILFPLSKVLELMAEAGNAESRSDNRPRLEQLISTLGRMRAKECQSKESKSGGSSEAGFANKLLMPFSEEESRVLAKEQKLHIDLLSEWSTARIVLNAYGWLAKRVADTSVDESSLLAATLKLSAIPGENKELIHKNALVPFRASRFQAHFGADWINYFTIVESVVVRDPLTTKHSAEQEPKDELKTGKGKVIALRQ